MFSQTGTFSVLMQLRGQRSFYLTLYLVHITLPRNSVLFVSFGFRMNLPSFLQSSEDNQSVPNLCEPQMESHSFHSPDDGV